MSHFKTLHIRLFILHYILLEYILCVWRERERERERLSELRDKKTLKYKIQMNSSHVNIHDHCSNYRNLQKFRLANVDNFWA